MTITIQDVQNKLNAIQNKKQKLANLQAENRQQEAILEELNKELETINTAIEEETQKITSKMEVLESVSRDLDNQIQIENQKGALINQDRIIANKNIEDRQKDLTVYKELSKTIDEEGSIEVEHPSPKHEGQTDEETEDNKEEKIIISKEILKECQARKLRLVNKKLSDTSLKQIITEIGRELYKFAPEDREENIESIEKNYEWCEPLLTQQQKEMWIDKMKELVEEVEIMPFEINS